MQPTYCAAPWRGLHINFRGDVKTCCAGNPNILGNVNDQPIESIVYGPALREIRQHILQGQLHPEYCSNCINSERFGRSERHWHNDVNQDFDIATASLDDYNPTIVDIRWNTTCNLSCNYCGPYCSSKWQSIRQQIEIRDGIRGYYDTVCEFLQQHASNIREVAMVGGEPFLLMENNRLLDVIPEDCIVTVITNLSVRLDNNPIWHKLQQRRRVGWSMSFDNIAARFEYVRHGAEWSRLNTNIDQVQRLMRENGHWGGIHAVYNIYNCTRLVEFRKWAHDRGLTVLWQNLFQPEHLDPMRHSAALRALAAAEAQRLLDQCGTYMAEPEQDFFKCAINNLQSNQSDSSEVTKKFQEHIWSIENKDHPDKHGQFESLWPELYEIYRHQA